MKDKYPCFNADYQNNKINHYGLTSYSQTVDEKIIRVLLVKN